jgi:hypothetical protein
MEPVSGDVLSLTGHWCKVIEEPNVIAAATIGGKSKRQAPISASTPKNAQTEKGISPQCRAYPERTTVTSS